MRPHGERRGDEARPVPRCCQRHSAARRAALPVAAVGAVAAVAVRRGAGLGAAMAPRQPGLPRAVLRWLQSLDLPACPRHCRRCAGPGRAKGGPGSGNRCQRPFVLSRQGLLQRVPGGGDPGALLPRRDPEPRLRDRQLAAHQAQQLGPAAAGEGSALQRAMAPLPAP